MTDLLQRGLSWLEDQRRSHLAQPITYEQAGQSVEVLATIGQTLFELVDDYGVRQQVQSQDFLVCAADLVIGGQEVLPKRGDRVRHSLGQISRVYEVMAPGKEPHFRFSDPYGRTLRIHTKQIGTQ